MTSPVPPLTELELEDVREYAAYGGAADWILSCPRRVLLGRLPATLEAQRTRTAELQVTLDVCASDNDLEDPDGDRGEVAGA